MKKFGKKKAPSPTPTKKKASPAAPAVVPGESLHSRSASPNGPAVPAAAPKVAPANMPKMAKLDESTLPPVETDADKLALLAFFLSPAACTEEAESAEAPDVKVLDPPQIQELLKKYVAGVESMYDRTGEMPLVDMFVMTYSNGLPIYASNPSVQQHTVQAMKAIFSEVAGEKHPEPWKRKVLARLADAFKACQAEQGRVIDAVYGMVTGRDKSFAQQVLMVVDQQKEMVLETTVNKLNPEAWKQGDDVPQKQVPHISSSYRIAVGSKLGLRGIRSAQMDHCRFEVPAADVPVVEETFRRLFTIDELCDTLVGDVNQQSKVSIARFVFDVAFLLTCALSFVGC